MSHHNTVWINDNQKHYQRILFIGHPQHLFVKQLSETLGRSGQLSVSLHPHSKLISTETAYDCYILDADFLGNIQVVTTHILSKNPTARILVISDSYNWEDAIHAFRLGVIDVIRTPSTSFLTRQMIDYAIAKQLPQRNQMNAGV